MYWPNQSIISRRNWFAQNTRQLIISLYPFERLAFFSLHLSPHFCLLCFLCRFNDFLERQIKQLQEKPKKKNDKYRSETTVTTTLVSCRLHANNFPQTICTVNVVVDVVHFVFWKLSIFSFRCCCFSFGGKNPRRRKTNVFSKSDWKIWGMMA